MTATTIPIFIILLLGMALGAVVGSLWGLGQHRHIYDWLSASLISRMQQAMRSCGYSQDEIDLVTHCMGCKIMPPNIPCPLPPEKQPEERMERIALQEDNELQQREQHALVANAQAITDQITVEMVNYDRLMAILEAGLVQAVRIENGAVYVDIDQYLTVENGDWLVRLKDGIMSRCLKTYHKKMEQAGLISGGCFGFKDIPQR